MELWESEHLAGYRVSLFQVPQYPLIESKASNKYGEILKIGQGDTYR